MEKSIMAPKKETNRKSREVKVLAFEKKIVPSDGYMYGSRWDSRLDKIRPLSIREKSVRGTISNSLPDTVLNDPLKLSARIENANPQTVDCCFLGQDEDTLVVKFSLKFLGNLDIPSACSDGEFLEKYKKALNTYKIEYRFSELSFRYAYNIACARFIWRNRLGADKIEVRVRDCFDNKEWIFDAKSYGLRAFDERKRDELNSFSERIAKAFMSKESALFDVACYSCIGQAQEVYPSEEMILDKNKEDKKSKVLYSADNCAAFHSQKIGNAIRTIDTWYAEYDTANGVGPIAIDSYGPVTTMSKAFRANKKTDFYSIKDAYIWDEDAVNVEDKHYFMAMIIRGGVFGESSKE